MTMVAVAVARRVRIAIASAAAHTAGTFSVPGRSPASCPPPLIIGDELDGAPPHEHADAQRSTDLVRGERREVDPPAVELDRHAPERLDRVRVQPRAVSPASRAARSASSVSVPTSLLAAVTETSATPPERGARQRRDVRPPLRVDADAEHGPAVRPRGARPGPGPTSARPRRSRGRARPARQRDAEGARFEDVLMARNPTDPFAHKPELGLELKKALRA